MPRNRDLDSLFEEALQLPPDARSAFLDTHCGDDAEGRRTIEELLRESDEGDPVLKPGGVFEGPLWEELLTESDELTAGACLGPYEIRGSLGAGGMGEVYRAHDTRLSRDVAIKVLPASSGSMDALARFEREARAVAALNHPNILAIHDVGAEGAVHFVVTELLEGETLRARLRARGLVAPAEAVTYGVQIARGLAAAHDRGIIHRDLKPDNIFITRDGRIKVLDFGIAIFDQASIPTGEHAQITRTGQVVGTVGYMAPEQLLAHSATAQSDLFGFGVVMHEMLTGSHPFARQTAPEVQTAVLREDPAPLSRAVPGLSPSLVRVIERCLEKQPAQRPESARDLAMFLEALGDAPTPVAPPFENEPARRLRIRLLAAACGLLLLGLAAWGYVRFSTERAAREIVASELVRAERMTRYIHDEQRARIGLVALLFASLPELKAAFATDFATIRDFLLQYQQRTPGLPLLVAIGPDGTVLARTDEPAPPAPARRDEWLDALLSIPGEASVVDIGSRPSIAVAVTLEAAGTVFGYVVAAQALDQRFAQAVSEATQDGVVLLSDSAVLGTTLRSGQNPWRSLAAWRASGGSAGGTIETRIGTQSYFAHEVPLGSRPAVSAVIVRSRDEAFAPYDRLQKGVMMIALIAGAAVLSSALWAPRLVRRRRNTPDHRL
jgi:Protein kinase domain/Double sensory domain of two-component sensor kinase